MFDRIGRHTFENIHGVVTHHVIRFPIHMNLKTTTTINFNIILAIHRYQRDFTQHFQYCIGFRVRIILHIILYFIYISFHQRFLRNDLNTSQFIGGFRSVQSAQINNLLIHFHLKIFNHSTFSYRGNRNRMNTRHSINLFLKFSLHIGNCHLYCLIRLRLFHNPNGSIGFTFQS